MSGTLVAGAMFRSNADEAEVIVDQAVFVLECSEEDRLADWLVELMGQRCRELRTR